METWNAWARILPPPDEASPGVAGEHASLNEWRQELCLPILTVLEDGILPGSE